jgi:colanic acid biosynthesis protein WcaH
MLTDSEFRDVVKNTPLIAIDFLVSNDKDQYLVGLRNNQPAKGFWFVPGGRIRKDERAREAVQRISTKEFGIELNLDTLEFIGSFEHIYETNFFNDPDFSTHYVTLGFKVKVADTSALKLDTQHSEVRWLTEDEIMKDEAIHLKTKAYFDPSVNPEIIIGLAKK